MSPTPAASRPHPQPTVMPVVPTLHFPNERSRPQPRPSGGKGGCTGVCGVDDAVVVDERRRNVARENCGGGLVLHGNVQDLAVLHDKVRIQLAPAGDVPYR